MAPVTANTSASFTGDQSEASLSAGTRASGELTGAVTVNLSAGARGVVSSVNRSVVKISSCIPSQGQQLIQETPHKPQLCGC